MTERDKYPPLLVCGPSTVTAQRMALQIVFHRQAFLRQDKCLSQLNGLVVRVACVYLATVKKCVVFLYQNKGNMSVVSSENQ